MSVELMEKLFEYIDARIMQERCRDSSDGGLSESMVCSALRDEILELVVEAK